MFIIRINSIETALVLEIILLIIYKPPYGDIGPFLDQDFIYKDGNSDNTDISNLEWYFSAPIEENGFRTIPGFTRYMINKEGQVWSRQQCRFQQPYKSKLGYMMFGLTPDKGPRKIYPLHRLLAMCWLELPKSYCKLQVNHKDGNKLNNVIENLEWVTHYENLLHAISTGLNSCGSKAVLLRDVTTMKIMEFPSHASCARFLNIYTKLVDFRIKSDGQRVYAGKYQFKHKDSGTEFKDI